MHAFDGEFHALGPDVVARGANGIPGGGQVRLPDEGDLRLFRKEIDRDVGDARQIAESRLHVGNARRAMHPLHGDARPLERGVSRGQQEHC